MARPAGCARLSVLITVATAALFGRAAEGRRYGRGDREIQPEPGLMGAVDLPRLKQAKGRQVFCHGPLFGPFAGRLLLDLGDFGGVILDAIEKLIAQLLVRHLAPAEAQRDLDLVALFEKALHRAHLHVVIVVVDHRPELDLLDLDDLLFLAGFRRLFLRLVFIFAVIENFADGRGRIGGDLDEIKPGLLGLVQSDLNFNRPVIVAALVDQLDFTNTDLLDDARAVLRGGLRGSRWATNGSALLMPLQRPCCCRVTKDQDKPRISQRPSVRFAAEPTRSPPSGRDRASSAP